MGAVRCVDGGKPTSRLLFPLDCPAQVNERHCVALRSEGAKSICARCYHIIVYIYV